MLTNKGGGVDDSDLVLLTFSFMDSTPLSFPLHVGCNKNNLPHLSPYPVPLLSKSSVTEYRHQHTQNRRVVFSSSSAVTLKKNRTLTLRCIFRVPHLNTNHYYHCKMRDWKQWRRFHWCILSAPWAGVQKPCTSTSLGGEVSSSSFLEISKSLNGFHKTAAHRHHTDWQLLMRRPWLRAAEASIMEAPSKVKYEKWNHIKIYM